MGHHVPVAPFQTPKNRAPIAISIKREKKSQIGKRIMNKFTPILSYQVTKLHAATLSSLYPGGTWGSCTLSEKLIL